MNRFKAYEANWAFLKHHPDSDWFDEVKLGTYFYRGHNSVPAYDTEGYASYMYDALGFSIVPSKKNPSDIALSSRLESC